MKHLLSFQIMGALFGIGLTVAGGFFLIRLKRYPELWRKLPRERNFGIVIGAVCFAWSAWIAYPLFEGGLTNLRNYLPYVAVAMTVLCFMFLEYVFTRALGGFLLLSTTTLMHQAFSDHAPARWLISIICYVIALASMFMIGSPWRFRDLLKSMTEKEKVRTAVGIGLACVGAVFIVIAGLTHGRTT